MPTYDYECGSCGHKFELFQSMKARPVRKCPACGKLKVRRLVGAGAGVIFKGSGFYQTDYRSDSYRQGAQKETSDGSSTASSGGDASSGGGTSATPATGGKDAGGSGASAAKAGESDKKS